MTLALGSTKTIEAHKVVLASGIQYFKTLLTQNKHQNPLIYMRNIHERDLLAVVDFLYLGEVNILQENLENFLNLAEDLQLKGLSGPNERKEDQHLVQPHKVGATEPSRRRRTKLDTQDTVQNTQAMFQGEDMGGTDQFDNQEMAMSLVSESPIPKSSVSFRDGNEELDIKIRSLMERIDGALSCTVCGMVNKRYKSDIKKHIESMHIEGGSHPCSICGK